MAPKRPSALDDPLSASPSSESEEISNTPQPQNPDNSDESEVESSEEEEERETSKEKEEERETAVEEEEERETAEEERETAEEEGETADKPSDDEDDDDDTASSDFTVKPVVSKPMIELPKPKNSPAPKSAPKQSSDVKKGKKPRIVRVWTEEGELATLRAMLEYRSEKRLDPSADMGAFYKFAKKLIPIEVTKTQVIDKIRRLRKKYKNNAQGDDRVFFKTHDLKTFQLSKKIWGGGGVAESGCKSAKRKLEIVEDSVEEESNKKAKKNNPLELVKYDGKEIVVKKGVVGCEDQVGFWDKYPRLKEAIEVENNGCFLKDGKKAMDFDLSKMGDVKAKELEDKWKHYQAREAELKLFKLELVVEQTKVVLGELTKL